jgi:hypothetical protein
MPLGQPPRRPRALPTGLLVLTVALWSGVPDAAAQSSGTGGSRIAPTTPAAPGSSPGAVTPDPSGLQALPDLTIGVLHGSVGQTGSNISVSVHNNGAKAGPSTLKVECAPFAVTKTPSIPKTQSSPGLSSTLLYHAAPTYAAWCFSTKTLSVPSLDPGKTHTASLGATKCGLQQFRHEVTATADAGQQVKESNENNNQKKAFLPNW